MRNTGGQVLAVLAVASLTQVARAGQLTKVWAVVYAELNEGTLPAWRSREEATEWVQNRQAEVEPAVLAILRGERDDLPWTSGLAIARAIPTVQIRDVLIERMKGIIARTGMTGLVDERADVLALASCIKTLSSVNDIRILPLVSELAVKEHQNSSIVEQSIEALSRIGNAHSLASLRSISLRLTASHIERKCKFAERMIEARLAGRDLLEDADGELQSLTAAYLRALSTKDSRAYIDLHSFGYRKMMVQAEIPREIFNPEILDIVRLLRQIAGREVFEIDRDNLTAACTIDGRYKLTYVFELEGWRVAGLERVAP